MKLARSEGLGVLTNGILIVCLLAAVIELHLLRAAIATDRPLIDSGPPPADRSVAALAEPLQAISQRLAELAGTVLRPVAPATRDMDPSADPATPAAPEPPHEVREARVQRREVPTAGPSDAEAAIRSLTELIEDLAQRPLVARASIPTRSSDKAIDAGAVSATMSAVRGSQVEKSRLLGASPTDLVAWYGKPTAIEVMESGEVAWNYQTVRDRDGLSFVLYDGRVIDLWIPD